MSARGSASRTRPHGRRRCATSRRPPACTRRPRRARSTPTRARSSTRRPPSACSRPPSALGYRPNPIARGLKTSRSYTIGVVVPDLRNPLFPPIARGIEERLEPAGYTSLLANTDNDPEREQLSFDALRARQVDGYITASARREHPLLQELAANGLPVVLVNRATDDASLPSVVADDRDGMRQAVDAPRRARPPADRPCRRARSSSRPACTGARASCRGWRQCGLPVDEDLVVDRRRFTEAEGARLCSELLEAAEFTAVLAGNDLMALGCIDALREAGLDCPARRLRRRLQRHGLERALLAAAHDGARAAPPRSASRPPTCCSSGSRIRRAAGAPRRAAGRAGRARLDLGTGRALAMHQLDVR